MYLDWQYCYLLRGIIKEGCVLPFILLIIQNKNQICHFINIIGRLNPCICNKNI